MIQKYIPQLTLGFIAFGFAIGMIAAPSVSMTPVVHAQTNAELQAQIQKLLGIISQLQEQLARQKVQESTVCPFTWSRNLTIGSMDPDVMRLQQFLNENTDTRLALNGPGSPGHETSYYGPITANAVARFQNKYASDVLSPVGLTAGTGFFGPMTQTKINELCRIAPMPPIEDDDEVDSSNDDEGAGSSGEDDEGEGSSGEDDGSCEGVTCQPETCQEAADPFLCLSITPLVSIATADPGDINETFNIDSDTEVNIVIKKPQMNGETYNIELSPNKDNYYDELRSELWRARASGASNIVFPRMKIPITPPGKNAHIYLSGFNDVKFDFNRAILIFNTSNAGIVVNDAKRVRFYNGIIKYGYQTASIARVVRENSSYAFELLPEFADSVRESTFSQNAETIGLAEKTNNGTWVFKIYNYDEIFTNRQSDKSDQIVYDASSNRFIPGENNGRRIPFNHGDHVIILHLANAGQAFVLRGFDIEDITIDSMQLRNIQGSAISGHVRRGLHIVNSIVSRDLEDPLSLLGATGAGLHILGFEGDLIVEDNRFAWTGDDIMNIHGMVRRVTEIDRSVNSVTTGPPAELLSGLPTFALENDNIAFMDGGINMLSFAKAVDDSEWISNLYHKVHLDRIPDNVEVGSLVTNATAAGRRVRISDNFIRYSRARAILLQSSNALVENNDIHTIARPGIMIYTGFNVFYEGFKASNILIKNNDVTRTATGVDSQERNKNQIHLEALDENWNLRPNHFENVIINNNRVTP